MLTVGAVLLAAGRSRRFGAGKLLAELAGRPLIDHALDAMAAYPFDAAICVVRADARIAEQLKGRVIIPVVNGDTDSGMGSSLAAGIAALPEVDAAFVVLADMPGLPADIFGRLVEALRVSAADIVVPCHGGVQGHPVLFARRCFPELLALQGETGGRDLIRSGAYSVETVDSEDPGILFDIDTPQDLQAFRP
ncbi:MAG: nucleotidyltransferase family protein, partial [Asticcacaulis sp.]|nr:nucleotidyltransferase family protein [Asticcacaulis sp.]